ncbi:MAG: HNH endonuclease [Nitrosopumilus sp.]
MSYEGKILAELRMPARKDVEESLLKALFRYNGVITEFSSNEKIVDEMAQDFGLNEIQRTTYLETIYRKENRVKKSLLWHRLLFRAADALAKEKLVSRPTQTIKLTNKREWMLTEKGFDKALDLLNIPIAQKDILATKSFEVQKIVKKLNRSPRPKNYNPFDNKKKVSKVTIRTTLRTRAFRQSVIEAYDYMCSICGMKINSPDSLSWEVEAAHIVPHRFMGKDDIWNGLALCHLHHWAFDVGWFTLFDTYKIQVSSGTQSLPSNFGKIEDYDFLKALSTNRSKILLPSRVEFYPHQKAIQWHRQNIFYH